MKSIAIAALVLCACVAPTLVSAQPRDGDAEKFWGQWRGPNATGVAPLADPPLEWSETKNVRWKIEVPGRGSASPIVWGDLLFVLTAVPVREPVQRQGDGGGQRRGSAQSIPVHEFITLAINRHTGQVVWQRVACTERPHEGHQLANGTFASGSAVTDGEHVYAYFGSRGLYAYDMEGNLQWERDFGTKFQRNAFGEGTTPALYENTLVITWDHLGGQSVTVAVDKRTGEDLWSADRDEIDTWATPLIVEHEGRVQVITPAMNHVRSYDLETGELVWQSRGTTMNAIPSPVAADGMVFVTSGYRGNSLQAIRLAGAKGDITGSDAIVWTLDRDTPYVPSPLLYGDTLYILKTNSGILSAFDPKTGEAHYRLQRLEGVPNVFASPVGAADRVYIPGRDGTTLVIRRGPKFEVLASNTLDDGFDASPAIVGNEIYLRGYTYLYAIAEE